MKLTIAIFTFNRKENQVTYNNIPDKYKDDIIFVIQEQEYDFFLNKYTNNKLFIVPNNIGIAKTRQLFYEAHKDDIVWMLDDDLIINKADLIDNKIIKHIINEDDFEDIINWIINNKYIHGGLMLPTFYSIKLWESNYQIIKRNNTNTFYHFNKIKHILLDFEKFILAEDYHTSLQLIEAGYKNIIHTRYLIKSKSYRKGGCNTYRTLELYNECMLDLQKYWSPEIIETSYNKDNRIKMKIRFKKLYMKNNI